MSQNVRKVKGQRTRPRKPRKKALQPPDGPAQMPNDSLFMKLPPELRNVIYELVIEEYRRSLARDKVSSIIYPNSISINGYKIPTGRGGCYGKDTIPVGLKKWPEPDLLLMSRQVRLEARPLYYSLSKFQVFTYGRDLGALLTVLNRITESLPPIPGARWPVKHVEIYLVKVQWSNVRQLLSLAQITMKYPVVVNTVYHTFGHMIEQAQELGMRGYREGWTDDWLAIEFEEWATKFPEVQDNSRWSVGFCEGYINKRWSRMPKDLERPGDNYSVKAGNERVSSFKGSSRNVPSSDRKLRSMS
ncbi:hypothetical protein CKM354_000090000 [Cercospora kikuchii]|uniref:Uncharacterized protein n=1 Tax=Cercospora kikuchii TaxID=84275 RepID=A0A9P3FC46_9PEZI|nr:uncharacterized protein CKM354_000090000 [Cercospora kikuchii]GIZ37454.1 hypothetical protein CKM354_000090000 [Cercospora kikuchii]